MTAPTRDGDREETYDLAIIGAGINGAGIARDAATRGLSVLLLDKADIASGTTSWSTRLIHGGLRYLEHREIGLVRESLRERERLLRLAPHLVRPLALVLPIYGGDRRGPWLIRLGMVAYDALSWDKSLARHRMLGDADARELVPGLNPEDLRGAAVYYDAQVEYAERLAVENALSARNHGANVRTYCRVDGLLREGSRVVGVRYTDLEDGAARTARAGVTVNVAGPWVDEVLAGVPWPGERYVGGTKGSHIIVGAFPGAPPHALYVEARGDGRPYFVVPWNDLYLIGTTDVRYEGSLDRVEASEEEIAYLLAETNRVIPEAGLARNDVLYTYAGIRPLPYERAGAEGTISRRHVVHDHAPRLEGFLSVVGGKLTTYRSLAELVLGRVYRLLGRVPPRAVTGRLPLPGAPLNPRAIRGRLEAAGLPELTVEHLLRVYGSRSLAVLALAEREGPERKVTSGPSRAPSPLIAHPSSLEGNQAGSYGDLPLREPIDAATGTIGAEVVFALRRELARGLGDVLLRRTMAGLGPDAGVGADRAAAEVACRYHGWTDERAADEVTAYRRYIERFHPRSLAGGGGRVAAAAS